MSKDAVASAVYLKESNGSLMNLLSPKKITEMLGVHGVRGICAEALPFSINDVTAGNETELQAVVMGHKSHVDLPAMIEGSNYYANILRRASTGDLNKNAVTDLEHWIESNHTAVWENSWVRFPVSCLGNHSRTILEEDLLQDKEIPEQGPRTDSGRFLISRTGEDFLRIPVSYLLKLALADVVDPERQVSRSITDEGHRLMDHFLSDNTSPETFSFHVTPPCKGNGLGKALAKETAKRFLLTQLLILYAHQRFRLSEYGQKVIVFFSPHPPIRQKQLNSCISDSFYRELFMNPCLSGWRKGEAKQDYMHLCHRVLSRSQLNALAKLKEAGIINKNLVVLPNTSNISLANNGVHISMGSIKLSAMLCDDVSGFTRRHEKYLGDLAIKIFEHFLPLFVGTYTAAPYRLDFSDFHPENVLGFLPHELDFTHLRMLWRRWQKKAKLKILGQPLTPFGPPWLDRGLSVLFGLRGDFIPDYRLIDYLVALMSTEKSPALNGVMNNHDRLKQDLSDLGVFDKRMSIYSFLRIREYDVMGFSGFEGRYYSLFPGFERDMAPAADLQHLLLALAFKYMANGVATHDAIPDDPFVESERRQIVFGSAVGIPTFFVRQDTPNLFLKRILINTGRVRPSHRYPGYLRVHHQEYRRALIQTLREDGADLLELFGMEEALKDLENRIESAADQSAFGQLRTGICETAGIQTPLFARGEEFNRSSEDYYRNTLRKSHFDEAWETLCEDVSHLPPDKSTERESLRLVLNGRDALRFLSGLRDDAFNEKASLDDIQSVIHLLILSLRMDKQSAEKVIHARQAGQSSVAGRQVTAH